MKSKKRILSETKQIQKVYDKLDNSKLTFRQFENRTRARMEAEGLKAHRAAVKEANTETFVSAAERSRANLLEGLKEDFNDEYKELQRLSRDAKGRFVSVKENLVWDKDKKGYYLHTISGDYFIDVSNSPKSVEIVRML